MITDHRALADMPIGSIFTLAGSLAAAFVLMIESHNEANLDPDAIFIDDLGTRVVFRWLMHPDASFIATQGWMWERTFADKNVWQRVT